MVNDVWSTFRFRDGRVVEQTDTFGFWAWSRQALGTPACCLAGCPSSAARPSRRRGPYSCRSDDGIVESDCLAHAGHINAEDPVVLA